MIKLLLGKLEKASEDPESAMNQAAGMSDSYDVKCISPQINVIPPQKNG